MAAEGGVEDRSRGEREDVEMTEFSSVQLPESNPTCWFERGQDEAEWMRE